MATGKSRDGSLSGKNEVVAFLNTLEHPLKAEIEEVREIILNAHTSLTEHIKWKAPSFCYGDEDRITFNLRGKDYFQLIFHRGSKVKETPGDEPILKDTTGLLQWITADRAMIKFTDIQDVDSKRE